MPGCAACCARAAVKHATIGNARFVDAAALLAEQARDGAAKIAAAHESLVAASIFALPGQRTREHVDAESKVRDGRSKTKPSSADPTVRAIAVRIASGVATRSIDVARAGGKGAKKNRSESPLSDCSQHRAAKDATGSARGNSIELYLSAHLNGTTTIERTLGAGFLRLRDRALQRRFGQSRASICAACSQTLHGKERTGFNFERHAIRANRRVRFKKNV